MVSYRIIHLLFLISITARRRCISCWQTIIKRKPIYKNGERRFNFFRHFRKKKSYITFINDNSHYNKPTTTNLQDEIDNYFMRMAIEQATIAASKNEVPIGAVVVKKLDDNGITNYNNNNHTTIIYEILSYGYNNVENTYDASAHAEMIALQNAGKYIHNWRLHNTTLYTTLEPCPICLSSCYAFRIQNIIYGASDYRLGAIHSYINLNTIFTTDHPFHTISSIRGGILEQECGDLLRQFFRKRREIKENIVNDKPTTQQQRRFLKSLPWPRRKS